MELSADLSHDRIRAAMKRIQAWSGLTGAPTLKQLLEHTVELTLNGRSAEIKESTLAVEVFGRKTSFDPRSDPIVRVQARKLRDRLSSWNETEGAQDEVVIDYKPGSYVPRFSLRSSRTLQQRSVAVLPFTNLSDTSAFDYVCDGIAEELRYVLSRVHGIRVVAQASSGSLRRRTDDIQAIGTLLNADLIVRGTLRWSGNEIRVTAELIASEDGFLVWAERWERANGDVFPLHDEIAAAVSAALRSQISAPIRTCTTAHNREAHDLYLKGRFFWNQRTDHGFRRAIEHYEAALRRDPGFARVYAALADTWTLLAAHHLEQPLPCLARASECAVKAVHLDSGLAAAHSSRASTLLIYDRKPEEAEQAWKQALRLDPTYAYAWHGLAVFGSFVWRRLDEGRAAIDQARRLEPLSAPIACDVGFTLYANGQYLEAIDACHAAIDLHPSFSRTYVCLARAHAALGRYAASVETCIQGRPLFTGRAFLGQLLATQAYSYGRLGRSDDAMNILHGLEQDSAEHYVALMDLAVIQTGMGNAALAIALLERANAAGEYWSISIPTEPLLHSLHGEPRFRSLAARLFQPDTPSR